MSENSAKIRLRDRLAFKMSVRLGALLVVVLSILAVVTGYQVSELVTRNANSTITRVAAQNADLAANYLNTMQVRSDSLAKALAKLDGLNLAVEEKKQLVHNIMSGVLDDERIFSVYTAWEPNVFFPDTPNGQSFYDYRDGGTIKTDILNDYQTYKDGEYYAASKQSGKPHITEPYQYTLTNGKTIWLISISNPIFSASGKLLGIATCDVQTDTINELSYEAGGYHSSFSYILSNAGTYLANTRDPSKMGSTYGADLQDTQAQEAAKQTLDSVKIGEQKETKEIDDVSGETDLAIYTPLKVSGIEEPLSSAFVVAQTEANADTWKIVTSIVLLSLGALAALVCSTALLLGRSLRPIKGVILLAENLKNGKLDTEIEVKSKDEFGHLTAVFRETSLVLKSYISEISFILATMASGDMRVATEHEYVGDFAPIQTALQEISGNLNRTLAMIGDTADQVNEGAEQVASGAQALASGAAEQAATVEQLNASVSTIAEQARENAEHVRTAMEVVTATSSSTKESNGHMKDLALTMQQIGEASDKINSITKAIEDIAFQTNILALNAAIESAHAGEAGKGFAVVADEVRNLAAKSTEAARQASVIIGLSTSKITEGIEKTVKSAQILEAVTLETTHIHDIMHQIEAASGDQANAIEQITQGLSQVSAVVQNNA
ncbi:MAG: methyl-accepting chemotaxis protein, partial [Lawsonibacter sp.]|nr:methyl-accepting chemotaxis protein [Lawsonibacter sp.]